MKKPILLCLFMFAALMVRADPELTSWLTTYSGKYARIYTNQTMLTNGTPLTTWSNGSENQTSPAYCGVQEIYSSTNWVYLRSSGLASFNMGPWYLDAQHSNEFPNLPANQKLLYRIPRTNTVPATKTENGGGQIGIFVDGVEMFNSWDAYTWDTSTSADKQNITGYWNRDAYINEGVSFDPAYAHQQNTGVYHYHADPIALRYQLGDHVSFNTTAKTYSESTNGSLKHSPILGWVSDGFPIYGPYGYSVATNTNSDIRRMVSGYVVRNGTYGTSNLTANGRTTIPAWAARLYNVSSNQPGPNVSGSYPLGRYMEDNDYLGDLGFTQGATNTVNGYTAAFDLDPYNGRYCVTPEFPNGTYAYFVAISSNGFPAFPYNIGRGFYGSPTGGSVTSINESVATNFLGGPSLVPLLNQPTASKGVVTLTWSATEGGTYMVQSSTNLSSWVTNSTGVAAVLTGAGYTNYPADPYRFYRVARTALATYDSVGTGGGTGGTTYPTYSVPGGIVSRGNGTNITLSITLPGNPPSPPTTDPIAYVTLGSLTATSTSYTTQGTVLANFMILSNTPTGSLNVVVDFTQGPPAYTFTGGLTLNP